MAVPRRSMNRLPWNAPPDIGALTPQALAGDQSVARVPYRTDRSHPQAHSDATWP